MKEDMLSLTAAADFLQISSEVLRRHAKNGVIPAHKEGRTWRFIQKELEAWLLAAGPVDCCTWFMIVLRVVSWPRKKPVIATIITNSDPKEKMA